MRCCIWRYFRQFGGAEHNYLVPDNVREEHGLVEAARVSPTNLGLLLNARQVACELRLPDGAGVGHAYGRVPVDIERMAQFPRAHLQLV